MSRKPVDFDEPMLRRIENLAGLGLGFGVIANTLGMSEKTLCRRKKDTEAVKAAIDRGLAIAQKNVAQSLYKRAVEDGEIAAIKWWEQTRAGRAETTRQIVDVKQRPTTLKIDLRNNEE